MARSPFDVANQNKDVDGRIVAALERIAQAFRVMLWKESVEFSLSPIQLQALIFLLNHSEEKRKVSFLADEFNMTKATISDTVKSLEEKKLVKKQTDRNDSRSSFIHLTAKGNDIARKASFFASALQTPVSQFSDSDKSDFLLNLLQIIHHLNKAGIITTQRMCFTCRYYKRKKNGHFCNLLNSKLETAELRIDCPEHQAQPVA
jgi:DNA-binding MarR family transcriptional regulator